MPINRLFRDGKIKPDEAERLNRASTFTLRALSLVDRNDQSARWSRARSSRLTRQAHTIPTRSRSCQAANSVRAKPSALPIGLPHRTGSLSFTSFGHCDALIVSLREPTIGNARRKSLSRDCVRLVQRRGISAATFMRSVGGCG
jgi:hypothetical protein